MTTERQDPTLYDHSVTLLSRKALSALELTQKLEDTGFSPDIIDPVLHTLEAHGYLNDEAIGSKIYQDGVRQHRGPLWIAQRLEKRRLSQTVIAHFFDLGQENALEHALELLGNRFQPSDFPDHAGKAYRFLLSRGYPPSVAEAALQGVLP